MSTQWPGGIISKTAPTVTGPTAGEGGSASGMWTLAETMVHEKAGTWPKKPILRELWGVGANESYGQLGITNDEENVSSPVQVGALTTWLYASSGYFHSLMTKKDGTLWVAGRSNYGQLGLGNTTTQTSPVQVGSLTTWKTVAAGNYTSYATKTDGTLWCWGLNHVGQLCQGDTTNTSSPVQIGALTTWEEVWFGGNSWRATKTDGTIWGGGRASGGFGNDSTDDRSSPVQVGDLATWATVSTNGKTTQAIKTDGTLWVCGSGTEGGLGLNNTTSYSSPVQVGSLTNWSSISSSANNNNFAVKTDGTMWSWGTNEYGALGVGDTTNRSSPTQIGALTTWSSVRGGAKRAAAIKTDGTLWTWGNNPYGALGQGNTTDYSSPVQIGSLTTWLKIGKQPNGGGMFIFKEPS